MKKIQYLKFGIIQELIIVVVVGMLFENSILTAISVAISSVSIILLFNQTRNKYLKYAIISDIGVGLVLSVLASIAQLDSVQNNVQLVANVVSIIGILLNQAKNYLLIMATQMYGDDGWMLDAAKVILCVSFLSLMVSIVKQFTVVELITQISGTALAIITSYLIAKCSFGMES